MKLIQIFLFIYCFSFFSQLKAQVFIPLGFYAERKNCSTTYCPILTMAAATLQGTGGSTQIVNSCEDDASISVAFPFDFFLNHTPYRNWFVGSNTYITAGVGSTLYSGLGGAVPAEPKFHLGAGDANYQRVYTRSGTNYIRIRTEGNSAYGTCSVNTVYEITFYRTTVNYQYVQIVFGSHGGTARPFGVASASAYYATTTPITANSSYVFYSTNGGVTWTILPNYSITGAGTTL